MSNFIAGFMIFSDILGSIGTNELESISKFDLRAFRKQNNLTFLNKLPEFNESCEHVTIKGEHCPIGTIIKRPLKITERLGTKIEFHYAIALGIDKSGASVIIENVPTENIRLGNITKFLSGLDINSLEFEFIPQSPMKRRTIIDRASIYQFDTYDLLDFNCIDFVRYCVHEIKPVKRSIGIRKAQIEFNKASIEFNKLYLSNPENAPMHAWLKRRIAELEKRNKIHERKIAEAIKEK